MSANDHNAIESQLQGLLGQLKAAEAALRAGMHTHGFGCSARAHMERALAHIAESYIALTEPKNARSVCQLVDDLNRVQQVMDDIKRRQCHAQRV